MSARRGILAAAKEHSSRTAWEPSIAMTDAEKRDLCRELLSEFGVVKMRETERGELIHSCCLPGGRHRNGDAAASASLNYRKLVYRCHGCGGRGGLLWLIGVCRDQDSDEARAWLSGATGTGGALMDLSRLLELVDALAKAPEGRPPLPRFDHSMLDPWDFIHPYMTQMRGVPEQTLDHFRVGYAERYPMGQGITQPRITIPLFWKGDLVGWQARALLKGDQPKYKNSPEFPRDRVLYGDTEHDVAVVVESPLTVLRRHHHMPNVLGTFGAQVADAQVRLLQRYRRVILCFDPDSAGWNATEYVGNQLTAHTQVWAWENPYDVDLGDMDDDTADHLVAEAVPFPVWQRPAVLQPWKG